MATDAQYGVRITRRPQADTLRAKVVRALPNELFAVRAESGAELTVHVSGKMRNRFVRLLPGDEVLIDRSPFDATKGRIVHEPSQNQHPHGRGIAAAQGGEPR